MRKTSILMMLALAQGLSGILFAQEKYGFEVGPYAGVSVWQDRTFQIGPPQASPPIRLDFSLAEKPVYGVRGNILSRKYWGGELSYSYESNQYTFARAGSTPVSLDGAIHHFFYNEVFYPTRYRTVTPFLTGGIGVAAYHLSDEARALAASARLGNLSRIDSRFAFNYGGGLKVNFPGHFGVRADFRHNFSDVPSFGLPKESRNPAQPVLPFQGKLQTYESTVGVYFHFTK